MTAPADTTREVAREVAARLGLPERAISLLPADGTVEEIEHAAAQLAALVEKHGREQQPEPEQVDPISFAIANRQAQKRRLAETILGRQQRQQPRDEHGRYASFDGGPRGQPIPTAPSPEQQHDQAILALARLRALGG
jgi:hypothetical protein